jgi:PKD repeat protein
MKYDIGRYLCHTGASIFLAVSLVIFSCTCLAFADTTETVSYTYYTDGQLKTEAYGTQKIGYIYDAAGNRTSKNTSSIVPKISASPIYLDFGETVVGTTAGARTITIANTGGDVLTISSVTINGTNSAEFVKQSDTCAGGSLQPADTCGIDIAFQSALPVEAKTASLVVASNAVDNPSLSISLSGSAILQHYSLSVTKAGTGSGTVGVGTGTLIWTGNIGTASYVIDTAVNVSAVAASDSSFMGWAGDCSGNSSPCSLTMPSGKTVTATFNAKTDFSATPVSGSAPLYVSFTDLSISNPSSWLWDFGDGSSSDMQNPNHTYRSSGNYTVTLTAAGLDGAVTMAKSAYISVSPCAKDPVKIGGTPYYYSTFHGAYSVISDSQTMQMQAVQLDENLNLQNGNNIRLQGGFGCEYDTNPGHTVISGTLTVKDGSVVVENIIIK